MRRRTMVTMLMAMVSVAMVVTLAGEACAQDRGGRQGARGGQRGMMGDMYYLERAWTAVSFQLDATPEQIAALTPIFREALTTRNELIQAAIEAQDFAGVQTAISDCKATLQAALQEQLTEAQWTKLDELMNARMMGGRPRGDGAGGPPPPPAN